MKKTFTPEFMAANCGCYTQEQFAACSFMQGEITLDSILNSEIPLKDKYWFCCKKIFTKEQNQQVAIGVAEIVLHLYENKYPNDDRPRKAIQAAKDYLAGVIRIDELMNRRADADAAAYSVAYAAAYTAAAAYSDDAAYAAYAAATAAAYSVDAADDALKQTLLTYLIDFVNNIE